MPTVTDHGPGKFCWLELAASDQKAAQRFYGELFGWTAEEIPMGDMGVYVMLRKDGKDVGALYENKQVPPNWLTYVSTESVDASVEKATGLGANVVNGPMDVFTAGRMAVLTDTEGAVFALWQGRDNKGIGLAGEAGALCWEELESHNAEAATKFYTSLFGWKTHGGAEYVELYRGEEPIGGIFPLPEELKQVPPNWMPYFLVDDCDASGKKAESLGGTTFVPPKDIPNTGRFTVIRDPQGAVFAMFTPLPRQA